MLEIKDKKERIGIVTLHRNINYGANLQAYAISNYLTQHSYECCIVDYMATRNDTENSVIKTMIAIFKNQCNFSIKKVFKLSISMMLFIPSRARRIRKFKDFRIKKMTMSEKCSDVDRIEKLGLDTIICGSDQIWNATITDGFDSVYYGNIKGINKVISYAASFGGYKYKDCEIEKVKELMSNVDYCSVREEDVRSCLLEKCNKESICVCDPVFLLESKDYQKIMIANNFKNKYVLLYSMVYDIKMAEDALKFAEENGFELIEITTAKNRKVKHGQIIDMGPEEFLDAMYNANTIFTNSFHGTAFSIIFKKDFYVYDNKFGGTRIFELLKKVNLLSRLISGSEKFKEAQEINYLEVDNNYKKTINKSKEFLQNSLNLSTQIANNCVGCNACVEICPTNAIKLERNFEGFQIAKINRIQCHDCGMCKQVCSEFQVGKGKLILPKFYAYKGLDDVREMSTSGGAFTNIAEIIFKLDGVVYGASMNSDFQTIHIRAESMDEINPIRGSKYTQSDISMCYESIVNDLKNNKPVLFSGTSCQVYGIKNYIKNANVSAEQLYLVDIICHGVASPIIFKDYIRFIEKKYNNSISKFYFRNKNVSWRGNSSLIKFSNGNVEHSNKFINSFMNLYYSNNITNESCYQCRFANLNKPADLTISDYWGIEKVMSDFEDKLGVSMIMTHTAKGEKILDEMIGVKVQTSSEGIMQPQLIGPCERPQSRSLFWQEYSNFGFEFIIKKYGGLKNNNKIVSKIKSLFSKMSIK